MTPARTLQPRAVWTDVCSIDDVIPNRGVAALLNGEQIAVFLLPGGEVFAIGNRDPFSRANVLARGIVGDHRGQPTVASPVYKQRFDLATGTCLDDSAVTIATFAARVHHGRIEVRSE
jgi:nitrite reductase (NADH) small subunit